MAFHTKRQARLFQARQHGQGVEIPNPHRAVLVCIEMLGNWHDLYIYIQYIYIIIYIYIYWPMPKKMLKKNESRHPGWKNHAEYLWLIHSLWGAEEKNISTSGVDQQFARNLPIAYISWTFGLPSDELTFCHGKSPLFMGKSTISMVIFNSYVKLPEGISH